MLRRLILATAILVMLPAAASAGYTYYGPHLGFSSGPDQFVLGGHLQWNGIAPQVAFVPGADVAFGDNFTMVSLNGDFHYQIAGTTKWRPYVGAGVGFHFPQGDNVSNDVQTGGHFILGAAVPLQTGGRFFTELKLGFDNSPDFKALAGWNFK
jgi:hypothetical protein